MNVLSLPEITDWYGNGKRPANIQEITKAWQFLKRQREKESRHKVLLDRQICELRKTRQILKNRNRKCSRTIATILETIPSSELVTYLSKRDEDSTGY